MSNRPAANEARITDSPIWIAATLALLVSFSFLMLVAFWIASALAGWID